MPRFSVIIPAYNRARLLPAAIDSVLAQETRDFELIVVDDGSTDGTIDVVRSYGEQVKLLSQPNRGPGAARNLGIRHARGATLPSSTAMICGSPGLYVFTPTFCRSTANQRLSPEVTSSLPSCAR